MKSNALSLPFAELSDDDTLKSENLVAAETDKPNSADADRDVSSPSGRWSSHGMAPMLRQYLKLKARYPEHSLFFQVGDFYEVFFEDAPIVASVLDIRLTSRNKGDENAIPMCGIPIHAIDNYLPRMLEAGLSCVLMSQVEASSQERKGVVAREITRIVTPGLRYEGDGLDERSYNYLASVCVYLQGGGAVAFVDVSTGHLKLQQFEAEDELAEILVRVSPSEMIVPLSVFGAPVDSSAPWFRELRRWAKSNGCHLVNRPFSRAPRKQLEEQVTSFYPSNHQEERFRAFGLEDVSSESHAAISVLLDYVTEMSFGRAPVFSSFTREERRSSVMIDAATRRNLELVQTSIDGAKKNSLLEHLDRSRTPMGARLFREWLLAPSTDLQLIKKRHDAVEELVAAAEYRSGFAEIFAGVRDIDRLVTRITSERAVPRDLRSLAESLTELPKLRILLEQCTASILVEFAADFDDLSDVRMKLDAALTDEPPLKLTEGGIIRSGFDAEVDRLQKLSREGKSCLAELEQREREKTGIPSLKVKYNNVFGYFIEVSNSHLAKIPEWFIRKQTLVNAERFVTEELKTFEQEILSARVRQQELEKELFIQLRSWVKEQALRLQRISAQIAAVDVLLSYAEVAAERNYVRPVIVDEAYCSIVRGRHPVVERIIGPHNFVANDTVLDAGGRRLAVLTGPNMGGKSTYLRQVGVIQLMAQAGAFVPARSASLGLVDRIFTRIGAADDMSSGDSTFMVEMREAAGILEKATSRSLVLIDEIGRGTATADGLALALAIAEWLHDLVGCRTIFATHFHELTSLPANHQAAFCLRVGIQEEDDEIIFTHRIEEAAADRSYGIEVARLAGLPRALIDRARELLLMPADLVGNAGFDCPEATVREKVIYRVPNKVESILKRIIESDLNNVTPIEALTELSRLQKFARDTLSS
ncbi:MAG: DNA mismatch repair protein MutS [bacterium]|nr:DNA mismatch repair protein MutS [bacterium]